jgi:cytoskeletal protein RodZ
MAKIAVKPAGNPLQKIEQEVGKQPWYVWAGALTGAGVVVWYVLKNRAATSSTSSASSASQAAASNSTLNGYDVSSMAGLPYGYTAGNGPTDNSAFPSFSNGTTSIPYLPAGVNPIYDPNGNLVGYQQAPASSTTPTSTTETGVVRTRNNSPASSAYDAKNAAGVPVRKTPGGAVAGYASYGSELQITGAPVTGPSNFASGANGSTLWYPTAQGYVSAFDIINVLTGNLQQQTGTGTGGYPSDWQNHLNSNRNTVDQRALALGLLN